MAKRYIIVCLACDGLTAVTRNDALTCSTRCRVTAHRKKLLSLPLTFPGMDRRDEAFGVLEGMAMDRLRPDLGAQFVSGKLMRFEQVRPDICQAFDELVQDELWTH